MVVSKATTLTRGYELPLNEFQVFGVSRHYGFHTDSDDDDDDDDDDNNNNNNKALGQ
jgi:hypothetical protein